DPLLANHDSDRRRKTQNASIGRACPPDAGTHRDLARGTADEAAWRDAKSATGRGGNAMNEWEWQLLEEKTLVDHLEILGVDMRPGSRVRLPPRPGGDVMDIALAGQTATIACI